MNVRQSNPEHTPNERSREEEAAEWFVRVTSESAGGGVRRRSLPGLTGGRSAQSSGLRRDSPGATARTALSRLLTASGLTFRIEGDSVTLERVVVQPDSGPMRLDPITVTARRIEELVQDAPSSVFAIPAEEIERSNITDIQGLKQRTPTGRTRSRHSGRFLNGRPEADGTPRRPRPIRRWLYRYAEHRRLDRLAGLRRPARPPLSTGGPAYGRPQRVVRPQRISRV